MVQLPCMLQLILVTLVECVKDLLFLSIRVQGIKNTGIFVECLLSKTSTENLEQVSLSMKENVILGESTLSALFKLLLQPLNNHVLAR